MKFNNHVLSIPPHISTSWKNINSLFIDENQNLVILLHSNEKIIIPNLEKAVISDIFDAHAKYLESGENQKENKEKKVASTPLQKGKAELPFLSFGPNGINSLSGAFEHDKNKQVPPIPEEILKKITTISKVMGMENIEMMPKAEPHCNCMFCQISRALHGEKALTEEIIGSNEEIEVTEEDLKFRSWDIKQDKENDKLYEVTNPLDSNEKYTVFLGNPVGCTCGEKNCEHIKMVLNT